MPTRRLQRSLFALSLALPLAVYAILAARFIRAGVGYQMDEALYVESAVFVLRDGHGTPPFVHEPAAWVSLAGRKWPLMIIPYVGAVKAYVALPIFAALGTGAGTARAAGVLLGGLGIAGLVVLVGTTTRPIAGLITGLLLAVHPSYLDLTVFDNGGVSVWMGAMGLTALALANHLARRSALSAFLLGVAAGFGVWARANFLWLLASLAAAALLVWGRRAIPRRIPGFAAAGGALLGALPLIVYELASRWGTLQFMAGASGPLSRDRIAERLRELALVMIADSEQRRIWTAVPPPDWQRVAGAVLLLATLGSIFVPARRDDLEMSGWRRFFGASAMILAVILLLSRLPVAPHHLVAVLPLALAALSILGVELGTRPGRRVAALAAAGGLAAVFVTADLHIARGLSETGGRRVFSSGIGDVLQDLRARGVGPDRLKILSWGFQNNLYVLSHGAIHGTELYWGATPELSSRGRSWDAELADGGTFLMLAFPAGQASLAAAADGFGAALGRHPAPLRERLFPDRSGAPYARIVEVTPAR